jgi:hypothetical protein
VLLLPVLFAALLGLAPARAQDSDPAGDLVRQIAGVSGPAARETVLGLTIPPIPGTPLADFVDRWFPESVTQVVTHELDREPIAGGGVRLTVEALIEAGATAELATWRLDIAPDPGGGTWRIRDARTVGTLAGLNRLALDPGRQFRARDLVIEAEDLELRLPDGVVFVAEAEGGATAAVLLGRGQMSFRPAPATERRQLEIFADAETLEATFEAAFIRFHPAEASRRLPADRLTAVPVAPDRFAQAERVFAEEAIKSFVVDLPHLSSDPWSLVPHRGDLVAEVRTRRHGTLTYIQSADDAEDVSLFDRRRRRSIASYASRARLAERGPFYDEDERAEFDVIEYDVSAAFTPSRLWLEGETRMRLRTRAAGTRTLTIRLADALVVQSVSSDVHGRLVHLRVRNQDRLIVNLPSAASPEDELALTIRYAGRLPPAGIDRENLQATQEPVLPGALPPALLQPEPAWVYTLRSYWYPQAPIPNYATAAIRIDVPEPLGAACSGAPVEGMPLTIRDRQGDPRRRFVYATERPVRYLACVVGRFTSDEHRTLRVPLGAGTPELTAAGGTGRDEGEVALHLMNATRDRRFTRDQADRTERILGFYGSLIGDVPYRDLTLASLEALSPGGHAPAHLIVLFQPLPVSPLEWSNDPAAFEGYGDFFLAHELAHQWWGQAVGWKNYHEQWLSEGFAQYFASLYAEYDRGEKVFRDILRHMTRWTRNESDSGPVYLGYRVGHLRNDSRAYRAVVYNKGALVLHMLRESLGDETFFEGLRRFYRSHRFSKAGTADLRAAMEAVSGQSLGPFFDRWIFGQDLPEVEVRWSADASHVRISVRQPSAFPFPLPVTLVHTDGSRSRVSVPVRGQTLDVALPIARPVRSVEFNDDNTIPVRVRD